MISYQTYKLINEATFNLGVSQRPALGLVGSKLQEMGFKPGEKMLDDEMPDEGGFPPDEGLEGEMGEEGAPGEPCPVCQGEEGDEECEICGGTGFFPEDPMMGGDEMGMDDEMPMGDEMGMDDEMPMGDEMGMDDEMGGEFGDEEMPMGDEMGGEFGDEEMSMDDEMGGEFGDEEMDGEEGEFGDEEEFDDEEEPLMKMRHSKKFMSPEDMETEDDPYAHDMERAVRSAYDDDDDDDYYSRSDFQHDDDMGIRRHKGIMGNSAMPRDAAMRKHSRKFMGKDCGTKKHMDKGCCNKYMKKEEACAADDFMNSLMGQTHNSYNTKHNSGLAEDALIALKGEEPEQPKAGDVGFAPQGKVGELGGGYTMDDFQDLPTLGD